MHCPTCGTETNWQEFKGKVLTYDAFREEMLAGQREINERLVGLLRIARRHVDFRPTSREDLEREERFIAEVDAELAKYPED